MTLRVDLDPLLEALDVDMEGPAVVAVGGGHGLAQALLAIQEYADRVTAVVGVADDGGSSGRLSPAMSIPPPGDIRRCLVALTPKGSVWRDLFEYRFDEGDVAGHSLGNLIVAALSRITGDFEDALRTAELYLGAVGTVVPVARRALGLEATIAGERVEGQRAITRTRGQITSLRVVPADEEANPRAVDAIAGADQIVLGPGSLYTSTIAALAVPGVADAVNASKAQLVYVCNLITQDGETIAMDASEHLEALVGLTGVRVPDTTVVSTSPVDVPAPLEAVRFDEAALAGLGTEVVTAPLADLAAAWPGHDPIRLGLVLREHSGM